MSKQGTVRGVFCLLFAALIVQAGLVLPARAQGSEYTDIYVLGRPATTFSPHPPKDLEELKDLFDRFEADIRVVLEKGGWGGDPDDFFLALRSAQEGDGTVTRRVVQPGESFQWMAYRKRGEPDVIRNPRWSAKQPYDAWQIRVVSEGTEYVFVIPQSCMNLAYDTSKELAGPTCEISATFDPATDTVTVVAKSDGEIKITSVGIPGGTGSVSDLQSVGPGRWTFQPTTDGTYNFNAEATRGKQTTTCSASVRVERAKPVCDLDVSVDPETNLISVDATASQGEFTLTGVSLPDGTAGDVADLQSAGDRRWTYDPEATLKKKPGDYTYGFAGASTLHGVESTCEAVAVIVQEAPEFRWIVRGFYAPVSPSTSPVNTEIPPTPGAASSSNFTSQQAVVDPTQPSFTQLHVEEGDGFGFDIEYMALPKLGVELTGIFADMESEFMWDQADLWLMDEDSVDITSFSLGANYHFTPDRRVDFLLGAFVGLVSFGDASFTLPEIDETFRIKFDDQFSYGLKAGVDVPFKRGGPWIFTAGVRYLLSDLDEDGGPRKISIDPLIGSIGFGYRW